MNRYERNAEKIIKSVEHDSLMENGWNMYNTYTELPYAKYGKDISGLDKPIDGSDKMCRIYRDDKVFYMHYMKGRSVPLISVSLDGMVTLEDKEFFESYHYPTSEKKGRENLVRQAVDRQIPIMGWCHPNINVDTQLFVIEKLYVDNPTPYIPTNFEVFKLTNSKLAHDRERLDLALSALWYGVSVADELQDVNIYGPATLMTIASCAELGVDICPFITPNLSGDDIELLYTNVRRNPAKYKAKSLKERKKK